MSSIVFSVLSHTPAILIIVQKEAAARAGEAPSSDKPRRQRKPTCIQTSTPVIYISLCILSYFSRILLVIIQADEE